VATGVTFAVNHLSIEKFRSFLVPNPRHGGCSSNPVGMGSSSALFSRFRFRWAASLGLATLVSLLAAACTPAPASTGGAATNKSGTDKDRPTDRDDGDGDGDGDDQEDDGDPNAPRTPEGDPDAFTPIDTTNIDPLFNAEMTRAKIAGISVAVVRDGSLKWAKGYGFANIQDKKPVTKDTVFMLASVSKTLTATALMQLIEDPARGITLDADINGKLPFSVRSPRFPNVPITYRMLLTHTSSLVDAPGYNQEPSPRPSGDSPTTLLSFEKAAVVNNGNWLQDRPGTKFQYSNTAVALAGLLVEQISGQNLNDYSKAKIFQPLLMKEASWFFKGLDATHIATPYEGTTIEAQGHYGYADYPAGQLRTSAPQLARFLMMFAGRGQYKSVRVLKESTADEMRRSQVPSIEPSQGLIWYTDTRAGTTLLGHNGDDQGVSTEMFFDPQTKAGYVLLMNSNRTTSDATLNGAVTKMGTKLLDLAKTLP
jgi:CubicO group peptidase (beta-lactamase class C family)